MENYAIGKTIKIERIKRDMNGLEFAEKAGIGNSYLSDIENDKYVPSLKILYKISLALGIKLEELLAMAYENGQEI